MLWDFAIQTDKTLEHNRPDITVIDKKSKKCLLIDPACPFDTLEKKEEEKCTNYNKLKYEIAKIWKMRKVEVIPVVIGALETVTKHFEKWIEKLDLDLTNGALEKPCLLGTAKMIRKVLSVGYEITKKKNENKEEEATVPKTTAWFLLLWHFSDLREKKK